MHRDEHIGPSLEPDRMTPKQWQEYDALQYSTPSHTPSRILWSNGEPYCGNIVADRSRLVLWEDIENGIVTVELIDEATVNTMINKDASKQSNLTLRNIL